MAVAYVRDAGLKTAAGFSGTTSGSFAALPTVGNHVIVGISLWDGDGNGAGVAQVTDNQSNSYSEDKEQNNTSGDCSATIYSTKVATSSGTYTITVDPVTASNLYIAWSAVEFSGLDATTWLDKTGSNNSTTGDANVTASGANATADGVAIGVASVSNEDSDINIGDTPPSGYTNIQVCETPITYIGLSFVYKIYSGSETSSAAWTHDNTSQYGWAAVIATYKMAAASGVSGSLSATLGDLTKTLDGDVAVDGDLTKTLDDLSKTLDGDVLVDGDLTKTLDDLSKTLAGTVAVDGDLTKDLEAFTLSSAGTVAGEISGTLDKTLDDLTRSLAGTVDVTGATSKTLDDLTRSIVGAVDIAGALSSTLGGVTLTAAGEVITGIFGSLDKTLDDLSKSIAGIVDIAGALDSTLGGVTLSAEGDTSLVGTLTATLANISYSLAATVTVDGDLSKTLDGLSISAIGVIGDITSYGILTATLGDLVVSLSGTVAVVGAATPTLGDVTCSASTALMSGVLGEQLIEDGLTIKALATNAGLVWIGKYTDDTVSSTTGFELAAGDELTFVWVNNLADIYVQKQVETDDLCWIRLFV